MSISPTPWKVNVDASGDIFISDANGEYIMEVGAQEDNALEDAEYVVAAVNAVAGTSIEYLLDPEY